MQYIMVIYSEVLGIALVHSTKLKAQEGIVYSGLASPISLL